MNVIVPFAFRVLRRAMVLILVGVFTAKSVTAQNDYPPTVREEVNTSWNVSGIVSDEAGNPIAGAKVYVTNRSAYRAMGVRIRETDRQTKTDRNGRYEITVRRRNRLQFVARGFAEKFCLVPKGNERNVQLTKGRSLTGVILLPDGKPATKAVVKAVNVYLPARKETLNRTSASALKEYPWRRFEEVVLSDDSQRRVSVDRQGRFKLDQIPTDAAVGISVVVPRHGEELLFFPPDGFPARFAPEPLAIVDNDFVHRIKAKGEVLIRAVDADTGRKLEIEKILVQQNVLLYGEFHEAPLVMHDRAYSVSAVPNEQTTAMWISPTQHTKYLGCRIEIPKIRSGQVIEKTVDLKRGVPVVVSVAEKGKKEGNERGTEKPVVNASIGWRTPNGAGLHSENGDFIRFDLRTDRDGKVEMCLPDAPGRVGVLGQVPGCRSFWQWDNRSPHISPEIWAESTRELSQGELGFDHATELKFVLNRSYSAKVLVVDENDRPVPDAVVTYGKLAQTDLVRRSAMVEDHTDETDKDGALETGNWYECVDQLDLFLFRLKQSFVEVEDLTMDSLEFQQSTVDGLPPILEAFSREGFRQGRAMIPVIVPDEGFSFNVQIKLMPGAIVLGRLADESGAPISDIEIAATTESFVQRRGQRWTTRTRKDGRFKLQGVPVGSKLNWTTDFTRVQTRRSRGRLSIVLENLEPSKSTDVGDIVCLDLGWLRDDLPPLNVDGLVGARAVRRLRKWLLSCRSRIPVGAHKYQNGYAFEDPIPSYERRVAEAVLPIMKKLAARQPGSDSELEMLEQLGGIINERSGGLPDTSINEWVRGRLLETQVTNKKAQSLIVSTIEKEPESDKRLEMLDIFVSASPAGEWKERALFMIARDHGKNVFRHLNNEFEEERNEQEMKKLESLFQSIAKSKFEDVALLRKTLLDEYRKKMKEIVLFKYNESRVDSFDKLIDKYFGE